MELLDKDVWVDKENHVAYDPYFNFFVHYCSEGNFSAIDRDKMECDTCRAPIPVNIIMMMKLRG